MGKGPLANRNSACKLRNKFTLDELKSAFDSREARCPFKSEQAAMAGAVQTAVSLQETQRTTPCRQLSPTG